MSKLTEMQERDQDFSEVVRLIGDARKKANRAVNAQLVDLYWMVGEYVSKKNSVERMGQSDCELFSRLHSATAARSTWILSAKYLAHASVL
jgi:hypothetical protein